MKKNIVMAMSGIAIIIAGYYLGMDGIVAGILAVIVMAIEKNFIE